MMMKHKLLAVVAGISLCAGLNVVQATEIDAAALFAKAKADTLEGPAYLYDVEFNVGAETAHGTVNMTAEAGKQLVVHSPPQEQWNEDFAKEVLEEERDFDADFWCQDMMEDLEGYTDVTEQGETLVYTVDMVVDPDKKEDAKFAKHIVAKLTLSVDDGAVLAYSMHAPKPFRPVIVAKINRFDLNVECARSPDGRTYIEFVQTDIEGKAMMKKFSEHQIRRASNLRPVNP